MADAASVKKGLEAASKARDEELTAAEERLCSGDKGCQQSL